MPKTQKDEERSVTLDEIKGGIQLKAGRPVVLVVSGVKAEGAPEDDPAALGDEEPAANGGTSPPPGGARQPGGLAAPPTPASAAPASALAPPSAPASPPAPAADKKDDPAGPKKVTLIELEDVHFRFDSAVFLPEPAADKPPDTPPVDVITGLDAIKTVLIHTKEAPQQKLLVTGHTDTKGPDAYNQVLSEERAAAALSLIQGDAESFAKVSQAKHQNKDVQQLLDWAGRVRKFDCDPQGIDGEFGPHSQAAMKGFKTDYNKAFEKSIPVNATVNQDFWRAIFDLYEAELARLLDEETVADLAGYRSSLQFVDAAKPCVGCGENWPIEGVGKDNFRSATNRRIEVLFFEPGEEPPLDCHPAKGKCDKPKCLVNLQTSFDKQHLPVHPNPRPQSKPTFLAPSRPGSATQVPLDGVVVYLAHYTKALALREVVRLRAKNGKLTDFLTGDEEFIDCDREVMIYCSNRTDLLDDPALRELHFNHDRSGLPLIAAHIPCGEKAELVLDLWAQGDWVLVAAPLIDGKRAEQVSMAAFREDYVLGRELTFKGKPAFFRFQTPAQKEKQEFWVRNPDGTIQVPEVLLVKLDNAGVDPLWVGTTSRIPQGMTSFKIFLVSDGLHAGSFNELKPGAGNLELLGQHTYDEKAVQRLLALKASSPKEATIDPLPAPPARFLLPGDICWHSQGQTNFCGAFSLAAAMNYWKPFTNNPKQKDGLFYNANIPTIALGARTPANLVDGANKFGCNARDNDCESTDRAHALKLVRNWVMAGVPVAVLVEESSPDITDLFADFVSFHWKVVVGWDADRFFLSNSGGDRESEDESLRKLAAERYRTAPVGSDVDGEADLYDKWHDAGGQLSDAFTSIDRCTFIPLFPTGAPFASDKVR